MAYREDSFRKGYLVTALFKLQVYEMVLAGISLAVEVYETELRGIFMSVI